MGNQTAHIASAFKYRITWANHRMLAVFRAGMRKDRFGQTKGKEGSGSEHKSLQRIKSVTKPTWLRLGL